MIVIQTCLSGDEWLEPPVRTRLNFIISLTRIREALAKSKNLIIYLEQVLYIYFLSNSSSS